MKVIRGGFVVWIMMQPGDANVPFSGRWHYPSLLLCLLAPSLAPDWVAQFLAEAPAEYARLETIEAQPG